MADTDPLVKGYADWIDDNDVLHENMPIRYMNEDEIKERQDLNVANTASAQRARVVAELAKTNGHSGNSST